MSARRAVRTVGGDVGGSARRSPRFWVVLGLLLERSGGGYELEQRIEEYEDLIGRQHTGNVYKTLRQLERAGLIELDARDRRGGSARGDSKQYRVTPEGKRYFGGLIVEEARAERRRSELLMRMLAIFADRPEEGLEIVERMNRDYADEVRATPIVAPDRSRLSPVAALSMSLMSEERRWAMESRLPLMDYARLAFRALRERSG